MVQLVSITIQNTGDGRAIVEAIKDDNPGTDVMEMPGAFKVDRAESLTINRGTVSEKLGREWDTEEIHLSMVSMAGNLDEDDDYFTLNWNR